MNAVAQHDVRQLQPSLLCPANDPLHIIGAKGKVGLEFTSEIHALTNDSFDDGQAYEAGALENVDEPSRLLGDAVWIWQRTRTETVLLDCRSPRKVRTTPRTSIRAHNKAPIRRADRGFNTSLSRRYC